jgi:hypothetical protein
MHCGTAIWSDWCRFASPPTVSRCLRHNILRIDDVQTFHRSARRGARRRREPDSNHRSLSYDQYPNGLLDVGGEIALLPRHPHLPRKGNGVTMCPVRSVTYVLGRSLLCRSFPRNLRGTGEAAAPRPTSQPLPLGGRGAPRSGKADPRLPPRSTNRGPQGDLPPAATCGSRVVQWHTPLVTEQIVSTEPGIGVPQGNTPDRDRTNTKPWVRVSQHRGCNTSHSHSHCNREPLLALSRVVQGQDRDLSRVQLPAATVTTMRPAGSTAMPATATTTMSTAMMVSE